MGFIKPRHALAALMLASAPALASAQNFPIGEWRVQTVDDIDWDEFHASLSANGKKGVDGKTGCNSFGAGYRQQGKDIAIIPVYSTRAGCPGSFEHQFLSALKTVNRLRLKTPDSLMLSGNGRSIRLTRSLALETPHHETRRGPAPAGDPVIGHQWHVRAIDSIDWDDFHVSLRMTGAETISGDTGCNIYTAKYRRRGPNIRVKIQAMTRGSCSGDYEAQFLAALKSVDRWRLDAPDGLILSGGGRTIRLTRDLTADRIVIVRGG